MNNIEYAGEKRGAKPHKVVIGDNKLRLTISTCDIREQDVN
jgi:hypothetical protein